MIKQKIFLLFELNAGKNQAGFAGLWDADYKCNNLQGMRSTVVCTAVMRLQPCKQGQ
jgi:hypothetical protein